MIKSESALAINLYSILIVSSDSNLKKKRNHSALIPYFYQGQPNRYAPTTSLFIGAILRLP